MPIEYSGVRELARALGRMPAELRLELRPELRKAGQIVADQAKANASWSTRIPGAISVSTSTTSRTGGVAVRVDHIKAPHARPLEGVTGNGIFRHPVFGNRSNWVDQPTRPFLFPAVRAKQAEAKALIAEAVRSATQIHLGL